MTSEAQGGVRHYVFNAFRHAEHTVPEGRLKKKAGVSASASVTNDSKPKFRN